MTDKIEYPKLVSPKGVAIYPHLNKADDKFGDPVFKVSLRISEEDAQDFITKVQEILDTLKSGKCTMLRPDDAKRLAQGVKNKKLKPADEAFVAEHDKDGNETGNILLKFKASGEYKDKEGNVKKRSIRFIDGARQPIEKAPDVWGGSILRVRAQLMPWVNAKFEYGVKLAIDLVQIIELKTGGSGYVNTDGFDDEDGYSSAGSAGKASDEGSEGSSGASDSEQDGDF
jgi:hypothetical protein